jgi:hypothetical protein
MSMTLQLVCECGNQLRVPEEHAGRRVKCPRCGASQVVPQQLPAPGHAVRRQTEPVKFPRLVGPALALAVLLGAVAAGWWWFFGKGEASVAEDLSLIPSDAPAFVSVRVRDLWATPMAKQILTEARNRDPLGSDLTSRIERATGFPPEDIERVSLVGVDLERQLGWAVVKTARPYDREKVRLLLQRTREGTYQGKTYYTGDDPEERPLTLHFVSPTILVVGNEDGVKSCIAYSRSPTRGAKGALSPVLALCEGPHHLVAGFHPTPEAREHLNGNPALSGLADLRRAQLTGDVNAEAALEARAQSADEERAKEAHGAIQGGIGLAKLYLLTLAFKGGDQAKAARLGSRLLDQVKVEQQGRDLIATLKADAATVNAALNLLPGAPGR